MATTKLILASTDKVVLPSLLVGTGTSLVWAPTVLPTDCQCCDIYRKVTPRYALPQFVEPDNITNRLRWFTSEYDTKLASASVVNFQPEAEADIGVTPLQPRVVLVDPPDTPKTLKVMGGPEGLARCGQLSSGVSHGMGGGVRRRG